MTAVVNYTFLYGRKKPLTAAAFSVDGSVLAVAAETVITIWDPENNVLVAVIGESLEVICLQDHLFCVVPLNLFGEFTK